MHLQLLGSFSSSVCATLLVELGPVAPLVLAAALLPRLVDALLLLERTPFGLSAGRGTTTWSHTIAEKQ